MEFFDKARETISGSPVEKPAQIILDSYRSATYYPANKLYARRNNELQDIQKIIYGITPPARLRNIGDHAQAVAIHKWLYNHFDDYDVHEVDKDDSYRYMDGLESITTPDDPIFLHSGGNMGDRGMWSEEARRKYVDQFQNNPIISLPQTINFSDTKEGRNQLHKSKSIYNSHSNMTIIARDKYSYEFAQEHFKDCNVLVAPDFVLSLSYDFNAKREQEILLCLRRDEESILSNSDKNRIENTFERNNIKYKNYDTTLPNSIQKTEREDLLKTNLEIFAESEIVVTDRFHGIIFSVVTGRPCVALETVDHKIPESIRWFDNLPQVQLASDLSEIMEKVEQVKQADNKSINWNEHYFGPLAEDIQEKL